jgi:hypothetical protein
MTRFVCSTCWSFFDNVKDSPAGKQMRCPDCHAVAVVPEAQESAGGPKEPKPSRVWVVLDGCALLWLLCLLVVPLLILATGREPGSIKFFFIWLALILMTVVALTLFRRGVWGSETETRPVQSEGDKKRNHRHPTISQTAREQRPSTPLLRHQRWVSDKRRDNRRRGLK